MLIGKTYWKGLVLPNVLYGSEIIVFTKGELNRLQICDNQAYRHILKVPAYAAVQFLRGEVGASSAESRDIKNKLLFYKHAAFDGKNQLLKEVVTQDMQEKTTGWAKQVHTYMSELNLSENEIEMLEKRHIENRAYEWDDRKWLHDLGRKSTMKRYREEKQKIEEVKWFKNGYKFSVMMQARSDTLLLGWRDFKDEKGKLCKLCNQMVVETLEHFLIKCPGLQEVRNKYVFLQLPRQEDEEALIKMMLLLKINTEISNLTMINCVADIWNARKKLMESVLN